MAMTPSRIGQTLGAGATDALFLKVFSGEVLITFDTLSKAKDRFLTRTIQNGKSAQFPVFGDNTASLHTPGSEIQGNAFLHNEKVITIDGLLISPVSIASIDEAMNHYDVRQGYSHKSGYALAKQYDKNVLQVGINAARATTNLTGGFGGTQLVNANFRTSGSDLVTGVFAAAEALDDHDVPETDRMFFCRPGLYCLLVQAKDTINRWYGGEGSFAKGEVPMVGGLEIIKTNNIPKTNIAGSYNTNYNVNATNTAFLAAHKSAVGSVKLLDLAVESQWLIQFQATLVVAKFAMGHGILRPEAAVEGAIA